MKMKIKIKIIDPTFTSDIKIIESVTPPYLVTPKHDINLSRRHNLDNSTQYWCIRDKDNNVYVFGPSFGCICTVKEARELFNINNKFNNELPTRVVIYPLSFNKSFFL